MVNVPKPHVFPIHAGLKQPADVRPEIIQRVSNQFFPATTPLAAD